ncbi:integrase family protein [Candidatus Protofrankia californiensis]|uniref:Integrase family protein n=1 Tax=Candidatus Protofrankia californiensis TaxID=1839754 RepID=A0A1C3PH85_9ACTN|nr:integrase family protein [Candidatus Protofrankia californiensis]
MTTNPSGAGRPDLDGRPSSFDVRIWKINEIEGKEKITYQVRWRVGPQRHSRNYTTRRLAESRHAELLAATRRGEAFDIEEGIPVSELRATTPEPEPEPEQVRTWLEHARDFADVKWPRLAPTSRRSLAESLATVTPALLTGSPPTEVAELVREALYGWVFQTGRRTSVDRIGTRTENDPPATLTETLAWLESHARPVADLAEPEVARAALDRLATKLDGHPAGANTISRKRAVFFGCLEYAVERRDLAANPLASLAWTAPKVAEQVDRRVVVNHGQAKALLHKGVHPQTPNLVAFFGSIYYAAARPGEVQEIRQDDLVLPDTDDEWGMLTLSGNNPETSGQWTDSGERSSRQLKHRATKDTRPVPIVPPLVALYRRHLNEFGTAPDGRLFRGGRGGAVPGARYGDVWREARRRALTPAEVASPLAATPYDLRHAAVSTWLNAGVPPTLIAEWAGHSVAVLLHVYAKCIVGQDEAARLRVAAALGLDATDGTEP